MFDLPTTSQVAGVVALLAPGLIILLIRSRFKGGAVPGFQDQLLAYAVASAAYYAGAYPLFHATHGVKLPPWLWQLLLYFVLPCIVAVAIVLLDQSELFYRACRRIGLRLTHHVPAAWDYAFSQMIKGTYVLVKLQDGTEYAGLMGKGSFASTATEERDLYIEQVWQIEESGPWKRVEPKRSVLLCGRDIRWVEIFERIRDE
jgi:hypothetical protein